MDRSIAHPPLARPGARVPDARLGAPGSGDFEMRDGRRLLEQMRDVFQDRVDDLEHASARQLDRLAEKGARQLEELREDYEQQADFMNRMADWHKDYKKSLIDDVNAEPIYTCGDRLPDGSPTTAGAFLPVFAGEFTPANPTGTFSGHCFETINFEFEQTSTTSFDLHLDL